MHFLRQAYQQIHEDPDREEDVWVIVGGLIIQGTMVSFDKALKQLGRLESTPEDFPKEAYAKTEELFLVDVQIIQGTFRHHAEAMSIRFEGIAGYGLGHFVNLV